MGEPQSQRVTRLAPSPTGALHLGNARTFLVNWAMARQAGWRVVMRIEDLDGPRIKAGADRQAMDDLRWLGLDWDGEPTWQRQNLEPYRMALHKLRERGLIYRCTCSRREIEAAQSAPHGDEHELRYPGTCRPAGANGSNAFAMPCESDGLPPLDGASSEFAWRLLTPDREVSFTDAFAGPQCVNVQEQVGDFIVATRAGLPAYQLAVVIDDARQAVTDVVRGDDLLASTARQMLLYEMLDHAAPPRWHHLPLIVGPDGRRLAKRHGDTRLLWYRNQGVEPQRIVGLLAYWSGITSDREPMTAQRFRETFDPAKLPSQPITYTEDDHHWLLRQPNASIAAPQRHRRHQP